MQIRPVLTVRFSIGTLKPFVLAWKRLLQKIVKEPGQRRVHSVETFADLPQQTDFRG